MASIHEEEPHNNHETPGRQTKQISQLSHPHWDVWNGPAGDGETQVGLHAWWSTQSRLATLLSSLITRGWVGLQTLWRLRLKCLSIAEMVGTWCFGCCQAHRASPVGFLLLRYSVLFTVESLSLLYLLYISWFICSRRWCIDKLGVFHENQTSMCLDPHLN